MIQPFAENEVKLLFFAYNGVFALMSFLSIQISSRFAHNSALTLMGLKWANPLGTPGSNVYLDYLFAFL